MTPAGATAAARRAAGARRTARARGRAETAPTSPRVVPRAPRRVSGPGRRAAPRRGRAPWTARALAALRAMPDHVIVDRLTRGRLWIGLIGCLLLGLVSMQVALLKLNAGIGRAVQQSANLERRNGELRAQISRLGSEERIQLYLIHENEAAVAAGTASQAALVFAKHTLSYRGIARFGAAKFGRSRFAPRVI